MTSALVASDQMAHGQIQSLDAEIGKIQAEKQSIEETKKML